MTTQESKNTNNEVISAVEKMTAAFHASDLESVMESYAPQSTIVFEPGSPVSNREQQRAMFAQSFAIKPQFTYSGHEVFVAGDTAMHIAPWQMTGTAPDGSEIAQSGLSVAVLERSESGAWLIVLDDPHGQAMLSTK